MLPRMQDELFEVVDDTGNVLGLRRRRECHGNPALIHQAVHLLVFNRRGELFLQQRAKTKDIQPGKWDSSVGGHMQPGEIPLQAVLRMATNTPARAARLTDRGRIAPGCRADLVALDRDLNVVAVWQHGVRLR